MATNSDSPDHERGAASGGQADDGTFADVMNSFSFDSGRTKRKKKGRRANRAEQPESEQFEQQRLPQAEFAEQALDPSAASTDPSMEPVELPMEESASAVRPYAWTRGRTRSDIQLELETLISTSDLGRQQARNLQEEHYAISSMCMHPRSVAEIAALLSVPIGVARVLVGDMAESGLVIVHKTASVGDDHLPNLNLMERVLSGLRRL